MANEAVGMIETKGLVALVFVGMPAVIYLAITGEWRRWREFRLFSGLALLFVIAAPWHILAGLRNQDLGFLQIGCGARSSSGWSS